jgi:NAD(P)-dependent dehydrogenase (short-subunit alcohol dehydrogenase family)
MAVGGNRFDLEGKTALVVGASRGIGEACAIALAEAGANVALTSRETERLANVANVIEALGRRATCHVADTRRPTTLRALVGDVLAQHPAIDIVVYNTGTNVNRPALELEESDWDLIIDTNLKGAFVTLQSVGRHMIERGEGGRIINITSTFAAVGFYNRAAYAASKAGLLGLTRALAIEWAPHAINVNAVAPTAVHTQMNEALFQDPNWRAQVLSRIPMGRFAEPSDVAGAVVFLAGGAASMVTGHMLMVDGGWTAI